MPETLYLNASLPAICSLGFAYRGFDQLTLALDLRYFDYKDADLFGTSVRDGGLGWNSVFAAAVGANYQVNERVAVRAGYQYNTNPIPSTGTLFNVQAPAITQHLLSCGTTVAVSDAVSFSLGYSIAPQNSITGPVREATGTGVRIDAAAADAAVQHAVPLRRRPEAKAVLHGGGGRVDGAAPQADGVMMLIPQ